MILQVVYIWLGMLTGEYYHAETKFSCKSATPLFRMQRSSVHAELPSK